MHDHDAQLKALYEDVTHHHLTPLWTDERAILPSSPRPRAVPWLWNGADVLRMAKQSGELVTLERGGDRRAMGLTNPGLGGRPHATPTLWAAIQWLNGREVAPTHRHAYQAVRFIIDGRGAYSTVQGDRVYLERGDFILNPPWLWHDHGSDSDEPSIWMDGLDIPLSNYLNANFFEDGAEHAQTVTHTSNETVLKYGVGQMRPAWEPPLPAYSPLASYKWETTERALTNLAKVAASPFDDVALEYTSPHTGRSVMYTITAWIQLIRPGIHTKAHRQVNSAVYYVFEGSGYTVINGVQFNWKQGDFFVIPSWAWHEHRNTSGGDRAILFSIQDTPVLTALGMYREEAYAEHGGHQPVTGEFTGVAAAAVSR